MRRKITQGEITPEDLMKYDSRELASDAVKSKREATQNANLNARRSDWHIEHAKAGTGFFTCKKCGSKNTTYFQMQTRGADEPMTNFITCKDCKN